MPRRTRSQLPRRTAPTNPWSKPPQSRRKENGLEKTLRFALKKAGEQFIQQYQLGMYAADFYLPDRGLILEADGERWHPDATQATKSKWAAKRYANGLKRDAFIRSKGFTPIHLRGGEIRKNADRLVQNILEEYPVL